MSVPRQGQSGQQYRPIAPTSTYIAPLVSAPTLRGFWRSDLRTTTGRRPARWVGALAVWLGLASIALFYVGLFGLIAVLVPVSLAISCTALLFALIAIIAGIGRVAGFFGLLLALIGNAYLIFLLFGVS